MSSLELGWRVVDFVQGLGSLFLGFRLGLLGLVWFVVVVFRSHDQSFAVCLVVGERHLFLCTGFQKNIIWVVP